MPDPNPKPERNTEYLNLPSEPKPMVDRQPNPNTTMLSSGWRLKFRIGEQTKQIAVEDEIVVGRKLDERGDIQFDLTPYGAYHFGVSRKHARLTLQEGFLYLEDLGSTNGTRINGFQLTPNQKYRLRDGDEVEFARLRTMLRFEKPTR